MIKEFNRKINMPDDEFCKSMIVLNTFDNFNTKIHIRKLLKTFIFNIYSYLNVSLIIIKKSSHFNYSIKNTNCFVDGIKI